MQIVIDIPKDIYEKLKSVYYGVNDKEISISEVNETFASIMHGTPLLKDHRQLAEWLRELKEFREREPYKWDNHKVACLLAELFGDDCACNFNGIDEWLPKKCDFKDICPDTVGVACWEQFLKHRERSE